MLSNGGIIGKPNIVQSGIWNLDDSFGDVNYIRSQPSIGGVDGYTVLMLHMNGTHGSTTFTDSSSSAHAMTANGATSISNAQGYFGGTSGYFNGSSDYLSSADHADWNFDNGDFTIDFRFRPSGTSPNGGFFNQRADANNGVHFYINAGGIHFYVRGGSTTVAYYYNSSLSWTANTWYHIALVRNGTSVALYINGVSQSLTVSTAISANAMPDVAAEARIGYDGQNTTYLLGYLDEFRVSKGLARWTGNFTPPSSAYS